MSATTPLTFDDVLAAIRPWEKRRVAVACGHDEAVLDAVERAEKDNVADCDHVGD